MLKKLQGELQVFERDLKYGFISNSSMRVLYLAIPAAAALLACTAVAQVSPEPQRAQPTKKEGPVPGWILSPGPIRARGLPVSQV